MSKFYSIDADELSGRNNNCKMLVEIAKALPDGFICGGAVRRSLMPGCSPLDSDIDMFFRDADEMIFAKDALLGMGFKQLSENSTNTTMSGKLEIGDVFRGLKVQLIHIAYYSEVKDVLDSFDFTICQFGYDSNTRQFWFSSVAMIDLMSKRIVVHKVTYAVSTVRRLMKYAKQGYLVCGGCIASILNAVASDPSIVNDNIEYID